MATDVQWSELQRDPKGVAALVDKGDVRVRRRDGATLLLTHEDRLASTAEGAVLAARALRSLLAHLPADAVATVAGALVDEFPWLDVLPEGDRAQFITDFARAFQASAELGQWSTLAQKIHEWRNTAAVHADPALARLGSWRNHSTKPTTDRFQVQLRREPRRQSVATAYHRRGGPVGRCRRSFVRQVQPPDNATGILPDSQLTGTGGGGGHP